MDKLYSFGCSFSDVIFKNNNILLYNYNQHKLYTELLAEKLELELVCNARPGRGNNTMLVDIASTDFEDNSIIIIQLTFFYRLEFLIKSYDSKTLHFESPKIRPFTSATLEQWETDMYINKKHIESYANFVETFYDILCFNDLYSIFNVIENKKLKSKNCNFFVISAEPINKKNFEKDKYLFNMICLNGFMDSHIYPNYSDTDPHLNELGNLNLFTNLYKIIYDTHK
jgi:hypothetical protein